MKKILERIYLAFIFILLYAPILTLIILSFNASKTRAKWGGWTLKWYISMFQNSAIMDALYNTLLIAVLSATVATLLGLTAAISLNKMKRRAKTLVLGIINIPMLNAEIVTGISLMLVFIAVGNFLTNFGYSIQFGFWTVLIGHITFNLPYVVLSILPKLKQVNMSTYEAALDLGASHSYAFWKVVLPELVPGIMAGFMLSFTMSLDDFSVTYFTKAPGIHTMSTMINAEYRKGIQTELYALSTIVFVLVLLVLFLMNRKAWRTTKKAERKGGGLS